jgi:hypothetical protein
MAESMAALTVVLKVASTVEMWDNYLDIELAGLSAETTAVLLAESTAALMVQRLVVTMANMTVASLGETTAGRWAVMMAVQTAAMKAGR